MSEEFIVFDDMRDENSIALAVEEAERAGLKVAQFTDAHRAFDAVGFFTVGVVSSPGSRNYLSNYHKGLSLLEAASILDIPRAVFDDNAEALVGDLIRKDGGDIYVPRKPYEETQAALRAWVTKLVAA